MENMSYFFLLERALKIDMYGISKKLNNQFMFYELIIKI